MQPGAKTKAYRQNPVSIRVRIIDPAFRGKDRLERETEVWKLLDTLPAEVQAEITLLLVLSPEETATSFANYEFENPIPSRL